MDREPSQCNYYGPGNSVHGRAGSTDNDVGDDPVERARSVFEEEDEAQDQARRDDEAFAQARMEALAEKALTDDTDGKKQTHYRQMLARKQLEAELEYLREQLQMAQEKVREFSQVYHEKVALDQETRKSPPNATLTRASSFQLNAVDIAYHNLLLAQEKVKDVRDAIDAVNDKAHRDGVFQ
jgi:hypothetical protein